MEITRRKFLKKSVGVVAAVIVGPAVLSAIPEKVEAEELNPLDQWGRLVGISQHPLEPDDKFKVRVMNKIRMK